MLYILGLSGAILRQWKDEETMNYKIFYICFAILGVMTGCNGTKGLVQPRIDMPESFTKMPATDSLSIADLDWWEFYTDPTLKKILERALENNRDLLKAAARIEEMRQLYGVKKSDLLPQIGLDLGYNYETNKYNGGPVDKDPEHDLKFPISWEVNLWGSMFHARNAGKARYVASEEDYRAMRMELIAEVASTYIQLLSLENELTIVRHTLTTREEALHQAKIRFEGGLTSETVYQQAKVEYSSTAARVPDLELSITEKRNALTMLMGEYPHDIIEDYRFKFDRSLETQLPTGIPSELLKRRPDLRASEQRLKAAMEDVGMTYADRFPTLKIGFTPGFENDGLKDFFKSPFTYTVAAITGPIFDFGRKKRKYQASIAVYEQARLEYEKAVIQAFTEVNTAVTAYSKYLENKRLMNELCEAAAKYVRLAELQYRGGTLNYIDVLDAQRQYFSARTSVNSATRDEYLALINLYKVLGGGISVN